MIRELAKAILPERVAFQIKKIIYGRHRSIEKKLVASNKAYKNIHEGKRCFILGNGPSMKNIDMGLLHDEITITVNQIARRADYGKLNANYHFWADERFFQIDLEKGIDLELYDYMKKVKDENNSPVVFYKTSAYEMIKRTGLEKELNIKYFMEIGCDMPKDSEYMELDGMLPVFSTVVQYAIVAAVYMGFKEIYLLGCDTTGIINEIEARVNQGKVEYSYDVSEEEKKRMKKAALQNSMQMELMGTVRILDDYEKLYKYCHKNGCDLYNLSDPTLIESIPKKRLQDVI